MRVTTAKDDQGDSYTFLSGSFPVQKEVHYYALPHHYYALELVLLGHVTLFVHAFLM